ncbi:MAG: hypothetical protein M1837_006624 [Sclerophora amabilis]|nr:MAG: hypothetical protein M1837_006624 [Sclerophora amabilis]
MHASLFITAIALSLAGSSWAAATCIKGDANLYKVSMIDCVWASQEFGGLTVEDIKNGGGDRSAKDCTTRWSNAPLAPDAVVPSAQSISEGIKAGILAIREDCDDQGFVGTSAPVIGPDGAALGKVELVKNDY